MNESSELKPTLSSMLLDLNQRNAPTAPDDDEQLNRKQRHDSPPRLLAPPIPDLRFEEGVMVSIQPYLHPLDSTVEIPDEGILPRLIQKGVRIDWMQVTLILVRDQVIFPLAQGVLWGVLGMWASSFFLYRQLKRSTPPVAPPRQVSPPMSLMARLGLS